MGYSLIHREAEQASAETLGPLLLQGLPPQEGDIRLELAGEGQACLQGTVIGAQVGVPVPVACGEESPGSVPSRGRGRAPPKAWGGGASSPAEGPLGEPSASALSAEVLGRHPRSTAPCSSDLPGKAGR